MINIPASTLEHLLDRSREQDFLIMFGEDQIVSAMRGDLHESGFEMESDLCEDEDITFGKFTTQHAELTLMNQSRVFDQFAFGEGAVCVGAYNNDVSIPPAMWSGAYICGRINSSTLIVRAFYDSAAATHRVTFGTDGGTVYYSYAIPEEVAQITVIVAQYSNQWTAYVATGSRLYKKVGQTGALNEVTISPQNAAFTRQFASGDNFAQFFTSRTGLAGAYRYSVTSAQFSNPITQKQRTLTYSTIARLDFKTDGKRGNLIGLVGTGLASRLDSREVVTINQLNRVNSVRHATFGGTGLTVNAALFDTWNQCEDPGGESLDPNPLFTVGNLLYTSRDIIQQAAESAFAHVKVDVNGAVTAFRIGSEPVTTFSAEEIVDGSLEISDYTVLPPTGFDVTTSDGQRRRYGGASDMYETGTTNVFMLPDYFFPEGWTFSESKSNKWYYPAYTPIVFSVFDANPALEPGDLVTVDLTDLEYGSLDIPIMHIEYVWAGRGSATYSATGGERRQISGADVSDYAVNAAAADTATHADQATNADYADIAEYATDAGHSDESDHATNADTATKLGSSNVGSSYRPVYLNGGVPTQCDESTTLYQILSHTSGGDFNNFTQPGVHYISGAASGFQNCFYSSGNIYGFLTVKSSTSGAVITQEFQTLTSNHKFFRAKASAGWSDWHHVLSFESGSGSGWTWKKYEDGTFEAWYKGSIKPVCTTARGSMYVPSGRSTLALPFTAAAAPVVMGNLAVAADAARLYWLTDVAPNTTTIYYLPTCNVSRNAVDTCELSFYVHGTY